MVEAKKPAETPDLSYKFSEQIDFKTGIPVGLVPLEVIRQKDLLRILQGSVYHDIGGGTGSSARYVLSLLPESVRPTIVAVVSEPYNDLSLENKIAIRNQTRDLIVLKIDASSAAGTVGAELTSTVNVVHLLEKDERLQLWERLFDTSSDASQHIISTTFVKNWIPREEKRKIESFMLSWSLQISRELRKKLTKEEYAQFQAGHKLEKLPLLDEAELVGEITEAGFEIQHQSIETMPCTLESYDFIRYDPEWLKFTTRGIDPKLASEVQGVALRKVMDEKGWTMSEPMPRNTLVIVARKPDDESVSSDSRTETKAPHERELVLV